MIRGLDQGQDCLFRNITVEIHIVPPTLIHMPCRADTFITNPQGFRLFRRGFHAAPVKDLYVDIAKPLAADIETEHIAAVRVPHARKRHLLCHMGQGQAIVPKHFNIHRLGFFGYIPLYPYPEPANLDAKGRSTTCAEATF